MPQPRTRALVTTAFVSFAALVVLLVGGGLPLGAQQTVPPAAGYLNAQQLQDLVAPIALYPDPLVAQILAASTYPSQVDDAQRWMEANGGLSSQQIADQVNTQGWDTSVMALTQYPSVLANLDQNLAWTSALGDAYYNQPDDVMAAIQALRRRALAAGTLRNTSQLTVIQNGSIISLEPGNPDLLYIPSYDAWQVYGSPLTPWPGYILGPGLVGRRGLSFGVAFNLGLFNNYAWGGGRRWQPDWQNHRIVYNNQPYVSHSPTFFNRGGTAGRPPANVHGGARYSPGPPAVAHGRAPVQPAPARGQNPQPRPGARLPPTGPPNRVAAPPARSAPPTERAAPPPNRPPTPAPRPAPTPTPRADRGFTPQPRPPVGTQSSAFSGFNHAAVTAGNAARGRTSLRSAPVAKPPAAKPAAPAKGRGGRGPGRGNSL